MLLRIEGSSPPKSIYFMPQTDHATLESYRQKADPLADNVIQQIMEKGYGRSIHTLFDQLISNHDYNKVDLPPEVEAYFEQTHGLPEWADPKKIEIGQSVFALYGPEICLMLLCKSLPLAYACKNGVQVMYRTGRMMEGPDGSLKKFTRRLMETSQFVMNVCAPGGFDSDGKAIITTQKVRLIHAAIRYFIQQEEWDAETLGLPINQEDLAGTLQSFSALILEGLGQLDIELTSEQQEGYYHIWHIVGHIIGLEIDLNPPTFEEGSKLGHAIFDHQFSASEAGGLLTQAVIAFMEDNMPGNLFKGTPEALIQFFVGEETAKMLGLHDHESKLAKIMPRIVKFVFDLDTKLESNSLLFRKISKEVSFKMLQGLLYHFNESKQIHFYIPPSLRENWKIG